MDFTQIPNVKGSIADWQQYIQHEVRTRQKKKNYAKKQFWGEQLNRIKFSLFFSVLNKYKRRKFLKTKNLLTGETEADPEMIKVRMIHGSRSLLRTVDI